MMRENIEGVMRFFCDLFFGTSGGIPLDQFGPSLGHPWSILSISCKISRTNLIPNSKIPEQQIVTTSSKKQTWNPE